MAYRTTCLFFFCFLLWSGNGLAATSGKKKNSPKAKTTAKAAPAKTPVKSVATPAAKETKRVPVSKTEPVDVSPSAEMGDIKHYKTKINSAIGVDFVSGVGSGFHLGAQYGMAVWDEVPFYVGPDVGFSLFSPGTLLSLSAAAWYELRIYGAPRLSMSLGAGMGPALAGGSPQFGTFLGHIFLEACISQQISDLASVRGQVRPAMVGGYFGFNMNLNVQFRFP